MGALRRDTINMIKVQTLDPTILLSLFLFTIVSSTLYSSHYVRLLVNLVYERIENPTYIIATLLVLFWPRNTWARQTNYPQL